MRRLHALFLLSALSAWAGTSTVTSVVLTNESGGLIDRLIAAGYGTSTPYQVLQLLQPYSNGAISTAFMAQLASCAPGSEIFTSQLSSFASSSMNPLAINSDGSVIVVDIYGRAYYGTTGYTSTSGTVGSAGNAMFTSADSPSYYIDTGVSTGSSSDTYKATAVIWAPSSTSANPLPPSALLMLTGLGGAAAFRLRRRFQSKG